MPNDCQCVSEQFRDGNPVFIDTLSFERYREGEPWVAYRQFCQHFLAPLALMHYTDIRLGLLFRQHIDGVPLDLAVRLLPLRTLLSISLAMHLHLHAKSQSHFADKPERALSRRMGKFALRGLVDSLESAVRGLRWKPSGTEWGGLLQRHQLLQRGPGRQGSHSERSAQHNRRKDGLGHGIEHRLLQPHTCRGRHVSCLFRQ